jgi:hypothetical protein
MKQKAIWTQKRGIYTSRKETDLRSLLATRIAQETEVATAEALLRVKLQPPRRYTNIDQTKRRQSRKKMPEDRNEGDARNTKVVLKTKY